MEVEEMQTQSCKFPRIRNSNGRIDPTKLGQKGSDDQYPDEEEADGEVKRGSSGGGSNRGGGGIAGGLDITTPGGLGRLCEWPSSRIVRVSRTSGGNDRYSKVWTSKGLRYRRVRLSVNTAIQFYDLQDRLGYDQPSKAVEWLLKAAVSGFGEGLGRLCGWPSSRIVRVSRASGGKDRHSKVWTSKGLRDRRVRLSVNTAIQFYDLQDRLGYDQPSKAVEWLLKAAASSIEDLPSINTSFPDTPQQLSDEKRSSAGTEHGFDSAEVEIDGEHNYQHQQQQRQHGTTLSKSACSSTSETSKGSGLSLSRSESRLKARERARERAAEKEKEKENESSRVPANQQQQHRNVNPISQNSSFTELLTSGINSNNNNTTSPNGSVHQNPGGGGNNGPCSESNFFQKSPRQWSSTPMDYFATGLLGPSSTRATHQSSTGFLGQIQLGNHLHQSLTPVSSPLFSVTGDHHPELPHFSFVPDHLVPVVTAGGGGGNCSHNSNAGNGNNSDYNLNFSISSSSSSGIAGFNRGTLQSNSSSPSLLPHIQRFSPIDGPSTFFISTAAPANAAVAPVENHHHQFLPGFDARLQLCYGDSGRHSDHKGKGKN